ncbi:hypothetical protein SH1V18_04120 [Vallitalea longa]|uniref:Uncharacterized protein n=1 Tax=Vallitalea longa TaxID=2936439 RepID=A0A9W6DE22_9FIRM|nr:hypothetical protein [Vallitalea longa]GKX27932.1 hypothetical protein SH1V18_04120 [Vallitalea longa]
MPAISKIRFTNVIYENGAKRYNDMIFDFDGQNGAILLENGGGKTVFIQTAIQAIIPHIDMANRKIKDTLSLESGPAHIAIEWIINEHPRRYAITATSLFIEKNMLGSVKYVYEYSGKSENDIEKIPFSIMQQNGKKRPSSKGEISEYYHRMNNKCIQAKVFDGINEYGGYIEEHFKIVPSEWRKIALINSSEGNVDEFFNQCKTTTALLNNLLIPVVEEAIEGNQAKGFVDTFEKQRDHFKKNKYLQEKITESKNVKEHIDDFIREFKDYDDCLKTYDDNKSKAKTLNRYLINLTEENEDNKKQNIDRKEKLINRKDEYNQKDLSYNILLLDEQLKEESDKLDIEEKLLSKYKEQINKLKSRKQNIEWTKLQNKIKINIEKIDFFKKKLKEFEKDISISELEDKLELNSSNIKGYYENELQIIIKDKQQLIAQKETYDREYSQINSKMDSIILKEDKVKEEIHRIEAQIEMLEKNMQQIADTMSLPLDTNNINGCIHDWKTRLTELENKMLDIIREKKELNTEIGNKRVQREQTKENYYSTKLELEENKRELNQQRQEEEKLYQELIEHGQYINTHSNIYLKEESILQRLIEKQRLLNDNKEKSLLKERISKRLQDLYENMDVFCAEPVMEKIVNSLKNKIGYITIGSQYLQSLINDGNFTKDILFDKYPYWAITIITTGKDKPVVEKKVESYKRELMYPIFIKTLDQIKSYMNYNDESNNIKEDKPVFPSIWIDNISRSEFIEWKSVNEKLAKETESIRKQNEQEYISCNDVLKHAKDFFITYPYEQISELEKNISDSEQKLISLKEKEEMINNIINQCSKDVVNIDNEKEKYMQEIRINEECVTRAIDFNNKNNDKNTKLKAYKSNNKLLQTYKNDKKLLQMEFDKIQDIIDDINTAISKLDNRKAIIIDNELYREIKNSDVNYSNMTLEVLCESRKSIKDRLRGLNFNRSAISDNLMREEENLSENTRSADYKSKEADFPLELLNVYNEEEIEKLIITIKEISKEIKLVNNKINKINKIISKHKWKKEELLMN